MRLAFIEDTCVVELELYLVVVTNEIIYRGENNRALKGISFEKIGFTEENIGFSTLKHIIE